MSDEPLVSVVIPVFNGDRFLDEAIASVRAQDHPSIEIIVSDDGSTDRSREVAEAAGADEIVGGPNRGPAAARNRGIEIARGDYIGFLDADDVMRPSKISRQLGYLLDEPSAGVVLTGFEPLIEEGVSPPLVVQMQMQQEQKSVLAAGSALARKEIFERIGRFNESYGLGEDTEWLWRVKQAGVAVGQISEPLFVRRLHGANLTYQDDGLRSGLLRAARDHLVRARSRSGRDDPLSDPGSPG